MSDKNPRKVMFVIQRISGGGAERQLVYILRDIDRTCFEPVLMLFRRTEHDESIIPPGIIVHYLGYRPSSLFSGFAAFVKYLGIVYKSRPDFIVSFLWKTNLMTMLIGILSFTKIVVSERICTDIELNSYKASFIWKFHIKKLYPLAGAVVAVSEDVAVSLKKIFVAGSDKITVINNAVDIASIRKCASEGSCEKPGFVLACGRLVYQKGFDMLIEALRDIDVELVILGEGPLEDFIREKCAQSGVALRLPGFQDNPYPYFSNSGLFVLSSRYEGFPNVILEAMACSTPVVSFDCPGGVRDVVKDGETGLLVPPGDIASMRNKIGLLLSDPGLRKRLSSAALENISKFDVPEMVKKYENILIRRC